MISVKLSMNMRGRWDSVEVEGGWFDGDESAFQ